MAVYMGSCKWLTILSLVSAVTVAVSAVTGVDDGRRDLICTTRPYHCRNTSPIPLCLEQKYIPTVHVNLAHSQLHNKSYVAHGMQ